MASDEPGVSQRLKTLEAMFQTFLEMSSKGGIGEQDPAIVTLKSALDEQQKQIDGMNEKLEEQTQKHEETIEELKSQHEADVKKGYEAFDKLKQAYDELKEKNDELEEKNKYLVEENAELHTKTRDSLKDSKKRALVNSPSSTQGNGTSVKQRRKPGKPTENSQRTVAKSLTMKMVDSSNKEQEGMDYSETMPKPPGKPYAAGSKPLETTEEEEQEDEVVSLRPQYRS